MAGTRLTPEKITSPFQLMAAWFSMLVLIASVLLTAAANISTPSWAAGYLVIFTSVVVILVLACVTLMLTVFRPHLQEGKEYARWLKDKNTYSAGIVVRENVFNTGRHKAIGGSVGIAQHEQSRKWIQVNVTDALGAQTLVNALSNKGFSAAIYNKMDSSNSLDEHEAIWVGHRVPFEDALEIIVLSKKLWPHLKYIELSNNSGDPPDEIHDQMYIGGSTSTALGNGLKPWTAEELSRLSESKTSSEFNAAIRQKYS